MVADHALGNQAIVAGHSFVEESTLSAQVLKARPPNFPPIFLLFEDFEVLWVYELEWIGLDKGLCPLHKLKGPRATRGLECSLMFEVLLGGDGLEEVFDLADEWIGARLPL